MEGESTVHSGIDDSREAKVCDFGDALVQQDVSGFDVAVDDLLGVERLEALDDVLEEDHGFDLRMILKAYLAEAAAVLGTEIPLEIPITAVFEKEIQVMGSAGDIIEVYDVRIVSLL